MNHWLNATRWLLIAFLVYVAAFMKEEQEGKWENNPSIMARQVARGISRRSFFRVAAGYLAKAEKQSPAERPKPLSRQVFALSTNPLFSSALRFTSLVVLGNRHVSTNVSTIRRGKWFTEYWCGIDSRRHNIWARSAPESRPVLYSCRRATIGSMCDA